jgi:hypothetical protein
MSLYGHRLLPPPLHCSEPGLDWIVASQQFPCYRTAAKQAVLAPTVPASTLLGRCAGASKAGIATVEQRYYQTGGLISFRC